jgi:hypothetical protein
MQRVADRLIIIEVFFSAEASSHTLACLSLFHAPFFTGLEVDGVFLYLFDNRFLLDFPLEPSEGLLYGFAILDNYEGQGLSPPLKMGKRYIADLPSVVNPLYNGGSLPAGMIKFNVFKSFGMMPAM